MKKLINFSYIILFVPYMAAAMSAQQNTCHFENMGGALPKRACSIRDFLKKVTKSIEEKTFDQITKRRFHNAWIFFGPEDSGKTKVSECIAKEAGAEIIQESASELIKRGNPPREIIEIFNRAKKLADQNKVVLIVIDQIDAFAAIGENKAELTFKTLSSQIDKYEFEPRIMVIFTCKNLQRLHGPFLQRCLTVEWKISSDENKKAFWRKIFGGGQSK